MCSGIVTLIYTACNIYYILSGFYYILFLLIVTFTCSNNKLNYDVSKVEVNPSSEQCLVYLCEKIYLG
jgi:hypothetical protein